MMKSMFFSMSASTRSPNTPTSDEAQNLSLGRSMTAEITRRIRQSSGRWAASISNSSGPASGRMAQASL